MSGVVINLGSGGGGSGVVIDLGEGGGGSGVVIDLSGGKDKEQNKSPFTTPPKEPAGKITLDSTRPGSGVQPGSSGATTGFPVLSKPEPLNSYTLQLVERGGAVRRTTRLMDVWKLASQPNTVGYAVEGAGTATLRGIGVQVLAGRYGVAGATDLRLRDGRLYGRLFAQSGNLPGSERNLTFAKWYRREDFLGARSSVNGRAGLRIFPGLRLSVASSSGQISEITFRASNKKGDDTYLSWEGSNVFGREGFPNPPVTVKNWTMPFMRDTAAQFAISWDGIISSTKYPPAYTGQIDRLLAALRSATLRGISADALTSLAMSWPGGAESWSRGGYWVRRRSWTNTTQQMRHDAGKGEVPAVFVIESNAIPRRVVRRSDFGPVEYRSHDWVLAAAPADEEIDLTEATLSLNAQQGWILFVDYSGLNQQGEEDDDGNGAGDGEDGCDCCQCP